MTHHGELVEISSGSARILSSSSFVAALEEALAAGTLNAAFSLKRKRGEPGVLCEVPGVSGRLHLRAMQHGGWLGPLLGERFAGMGRARAELEVHIALQERGAPVPTPVCAIERRRGLFSQLAFGTVYEEASTNGLDFLREEPSPAELRGACHAVGGALRRFHDVGGAHADLHLGNLLVVRKPAEAMRATIVDLDRARCGSPPDPARRMRELMRLRRSLARHGLGPSAGERGIARLFAGYLQGDRGLRRDLLHFLPREQRRMRLHSWRYRAPRAQSSSARGSQKSST